MSSHVIETTRVTTALDLADLLSSLRLTLRDMGVADTALDEVNLGTELDVSVIQNTLTDGSMTVDLRVVPVDTL